MAAWVVPHSVGPRFPGPLLYLKIFVKGKENRTLQLDNKLVDIKTSVYQRIIWRFFKMQVKMNLMHSELVLIKIILTNSQYLLNGC